MSKPYNTEQLKANVFELLNESQHNDAIARQLISDTTGYKKSRRNELFNEFKREWLTCVVACRDTNTTGGGIALPPTDTANDTHVEGLKFGDRYTYNKESDQYIVYLKSASKNVVISGDMHRNMLKAYSNWNGQAKTINEICRNFSLPRKWFEEYKTIMGWSHDHEPVSVEELATKDVNTVVDDVIQQKRFSLYQEFQKRDWAETQKDAQSWKDFKAGKLDPFESFMRNVDMKTYGVLPACHYRPHNTKSTLVVGLSDIHCGGLSDGKYVYNGKDWNIEEYHKNMASYISQLGARIESMVVKPHKIVVVGIGDVLHGVDGVTRKGTPLECDRIRDTQFDEAYNSIITFVNAMGTLAPEVDVHSVSGNHDGIFNRLLFRMVAVYYRNEPRVNVTVSNTETHAFKVHNTLILTQHGASELVKAKVPSKGKARESYIQSFLLSKPELLIGVNQKIFIMGDLHSFEHTEAQDFEYYRFSTFVKSDGYADSLNLKSRPRQNCLLITDDGVEECWHLYFD